MAQYRKKPVVVDAVQFSYDGPQVRGVFYPSRSEDGKTYEGDAFVITMHDQRVYLQNGDWIIAEPDGEHFYPCKDDVFQATYEPVRVSSKSVFDLEPGEGWQPYMTINAEPDLEPETLEALEAMGNAVVSQFTNELSADELRLIDSEVDKVVANNAELLGILSRLQSEHSDLIERECRLEQKLSAAIHRAADAEKAEQRVKELEALQEQYARDMGVLYKNTTERDKLRLYADKALAMLRSFPASRAENLFSPGIYSLRDDDAGAVGWWLAEVRRFLQDDVRQP